MLGAVDPILAPFAVMATAQVAAACVVTALLCPLLTTYMHKRIQKKQAMNEAKGVLLTE